MNRTVAQHHAFLTHDPKHVAEISPMFVASPLVMSMACLACVVMSSFLVHVDERNDSKNRLIIGNLID